MPAIVHSPAIPGIGRILHVWKSLDMPGADPRPAVVSGYRREPDGKIVGLWATLFGSPVMEITLGLLPDVEEYGMRWRWPERT